MIFTKLKAASLDESLRKRLAIAWQFLRDNDLTAFPDGPTEILPGEISANFMHYTTVPASEASFESHDRFLDIQYMIAGQEIIGVSERSRLTEKIPYREEQDITFYEDPVTIWTQLVLQAGTLATFMPEEAHKPKIAVGQPEMIHKVVVKVRI